MGAGQRGGGGDGGGRGREKEGGRGRQGEGRGREEEGGRRCGEGTGAHTQQPQADARLKVAKGKSLLKQVTPQEVDMIFSDLERDPATGLLKFEDMQHRIAEYRQVGVGGRGGVVVVWREEGFGLRKRKA